MHQWLLILFLLVTDPVIIQANQVRYLDTPEPFAIEVPTLETGVRKAINGMDLSIPTGARLSRVRLWLLEPYAGRISYGSFNASVSNQSVSTTKRGSATIGHFLDIDLTQNSNIVLNSDKSEIEVTAKDAERGVTYRCVFVLLRGGIARSARGDRQISCETLSSPANLNIDIRAGSGPPRLELHQPSGPIDYLENSPLIVRISGVAVDSQDESLTVIVNGEEIAKTPVREPHRKKRSNTMVGLDSEKPSDTRLQFDHSVTISPSVDTLLIEVRDRHENRQLCSIPINRSNLASQPKFGGRKYALVVGISEYASTDRGLENLRYAHSDARDIYELIQKPEGGGFARDEIIFLTDKDATLRAFRDAIDRFLNKAGQEDLIYLFLAGHGAPDLYYPENYYFLLHDSQVAKLKSTAYPMSKIGEFLKNRTGIRIVTFIDTCHSGKIITPAGAVKSEKKRETTGVITRGLGQRPPGRSSRDESATPLEQVDRFNFHNSLTFRKKGWSVITAAAANEESQESSRWGGGHGVFTWTLLSALRDWKADYNKDCQVTAEELGKYVRQLVAKETNGTQIPQILEGEQNGLVLASNPRCTPQKVIGSPNMMR